MVQAAIRFCTAVHEEDPHALERGLDLADLVAEWSGVIAANDEAGVG